MFTTATPKLKQHLRTLASLVALFAALQSGLAVATEPQAGSAVMRCGWFESPTPSNAWLIGAQLGHQTEGD